MKYKYVFHPVAAYEYESAYTWYYQVNENIGDNFIKTFENRMKLICSDPYRYRNTYRHLREISLKKFPYYIIYQVDESIKTIIVMSVYHHRRNPKGKYRKNR